MCVALLLVTFTLYLCPRCQIFFIDSTDLIMQQMPLLGLGLPLGPSSDNNFTLYVRVLFET